MCKIRFFDKLCGLLESKSLSLLIKPEGLNSLPQKTQKT